MRLGTGQWVSGDIHYGVIGNGNGQCDKGGNKGTDKRGVGPVNFNQ